MSGKDEQIKVMMNGLYVARAGRVCTAVAMAICACCTSAQDAPSQALPALSAGVAERYPAGSIKSVKKADAALAEVERERTRIDVRFTAEGQACHSRFFATSCMDEVKERRRQALLQLRAIKIEASAFKRQTRVAHRDRVLAERQAQVQADLSTPTGSALLAKPTRGGQQGKPSDVAHDAQAAAFTERSKKHEASLKRTPAEDAADAKKRAENIAAYKKKVRAAQARQSEIQSKKAEKERKHRIKQATPSSPQ